MKYRKLTASNDYSFGHGRADFYQDEPAAVAQAVKTRLALHAGEYWLDLSEGTPWETKVLGKYTGSTRDVVIRQRAQTTQGVKSLISYSSSLQRDTRAFSVNLKIDTIYGQIQTVAVL